MRLRGGIGHSSPCRRKVHHAALYQSTTHTTLPPSPTTQPPAHLTNAVSSTSSSPTSSPALNRTTIITKSGEPLSSPVLSFTPSRKAPCYVQQMMFSSVPPTSLQAPVDDVAVGQQHHTQATQLRATMEQLLTDDPDTK